MEICIKWTMCRTCTADNNSILQPLFDDTKLAKQLQEYAGIVAKPDDGLPDQICMDCIKNLQAVHAFLTSCKRSDAHLRSVVRRTMSSRKCFPSIVLEQDEDGRSLSKECRKPNYSERVPERQPQVKKIKILKSSLDHDADSEMSSPESMDAQQLPDAFVDSPQENETKLLLTLKCEDTTVKASDDSNLKCNEDFLLIVEKSGEMSESEATDNDVHEENLTEMDHSNNGRDSDNAFIEQDSYVAEVEVESKKSQFQSEAQKRSVLKQEQVPVEESASAVASLGVDLGAACELATFPKNSCPMCGNSFTSKSQLKSHLRTHRNEKSFECELCSKRFNAACNLTTHMRTHTGEKPFQCLECGRRFADRSTYRKHERLHTNERPYACDICAKTFSLSTTLKAHSLSHSKEKPHKCLTCNKGFRLPHHLKAHERTHIHRLGILLYNQDDAEYSSS